MKNLELELGRTEGERDNARREVQGLRQLFSDLTKDLDWHKAEVVRLNASPPRPSESVKRRLEELERGLVDMGSDNAAGELRIRDMEAAKETAEQREAEAKERLVEAEFSERALKEEGVRLMRELAERDRVIDEMEKAHKRALNRI